MEQSIGFLNYVRAGGIPTALLIVAVAIVLVRLLDATAARLGKWFAARRLLIHQLASFVRLAIYMAAAAGALGACFELNEQMMLALGGTLAVAAGFALKDLAASVLAGLTILVDRPFQVGDRVRFGDYYGEIREIGLRSVRLMTLDDTTVTIPNNKFLTEVVASGNAGAVDMMVQIDFYVGVDQDLQRARRIVAEALTSSRYISIRRRWAVVLEEVVGENWVSVRVRAKGYVLDVQYEKDFVTDVTERVLSAFREADIQPPLGMHPALLASAA